MDKDFFLVVFSSISLCAQMPDFSKEIKAEMSKISVLEGLGKNDDGETVHNAFGFISFDPFKKKDIVKSFLSNGLSTGADFEVIETNKSFKWWFKDNRGGTIKYSINFEGDNWNEIGEYSRDQESWMKFFEMNLKKVN